MKKSSHQKMTVSNKIAAFSIIGMLAIGIILFLSLALKGRAPLPILGEPGHVAGNFSFTNQDGQTVTERNVTGKVAVVEYFFTKCPSICPKMNANLKGVYEKFGSQSDFVILSHTVDPERDSVPVMRKYAEKYGATAPGWEFLTGNKDSLYARAIQDYLLSTVDSGADNFIHTQYVTLLDKQRRIRGFYDATSGAGIAKMDADIEQLLKENN